MGSTSNFVSTLLNAIPIPVFYKDRTGRYQGCNPAFTSIMGVSAEDIRGKTVYELWPSAQAEVYHRKDLELMALARRQDYEFEITDRHGDVRSVIFTKDVFYDDAGSVAGLIGTFLDITERKKTEEKLRESQARAESATRAKSEFLANMSHEIRTPMTVFMMAIEHLLEIDSDPAHRELLEMAEQSATRLRALVDDILDLSRIEAGKVEIVHEPFDLVECVHRAADMFRLGAQEKDVRLEVGIAADVPGVIAGDADRLGQILINLIGNAVKFTPEGEVRVSVHRCDGFLAFAVADTGIGIPEDKRDLLFRNFSQVDSSLTRQLKGTGLGLAISKELLTLMGGEISVQSQPGSGSVFTFTLPLHAVDRPPAPPATISSEPTFSP